MKTKNAGVTIVELVVVIAIMAIVAGLSLASIGNLSGYRARECARKISSAISANKVTTLGKAKSAGDITWKIGKEGNKVFFYVYQGGNEIEKTLMGKGRMTVEYTTKTSSSTNRQEISNAIPNYTSGGTALAIGYDRSSGKMCKADSATTLETTGSGEPKTSSLYSITVSNGGSGVFAKTYEIRVYPLTGKIKATW